jgi:carboxyl-terminal processing protease
VIKYILATIIVCLSLCFVGHVVYEKTNTKEPITQSKAWEESDISLSMVREFVNNNTCYTDSKAFFACINALNSPFDGKNKKIGFDGTIVSGNFGTLKAEYTIWKKQKKLKRINFEELLNTVNNTFKTGSTKYNQSLIINQFVAIYDDPHTYFVPTSFLQSKLNSKSKNFIGFYLGKNSKGKYYFKTILHESILNKAGMRVGDEVVSINGVKTASKTMSEVAKLLKPDDLTFVITRLGQEQTIRVNSTASINRISSRMLDAETGYIYFSVFYNHSCTDMNLQLGELKKHGMTHLILDLRNNLGGLMDEALCVANLFLPKNVLVYQEEYFSDRHTEYYATHSDAEYTGPMSVLINESTASSSEIVAGTLKDYGRAQIIGQTSFGKGSFQECRALDGSESITFCSTQGIYSNASGKTPQRVGVIPDILVKSEDTLMYNEKDNFFAIKSFYERKDKSLKTVIKRIEDGVDPEIFITLKEIALTKNFSQLPNKDEK